MNKFGPNGYVHSPCTAQPAALVRKTSKTLYFYSVVDTRSQKCVVQYKVKDSWVLLVLVGCEAESLRKFQRKILAHVDSHCRNSYASISVS